MWITTHRELSIIGKHDITAKDCEVISGILETDPHLSSFWPWDLHTHMQKFDANIVKHWPQVVGCIRLHPVAEFRWQKIIERWSLRVSPEYRKNGLARELMQNITHNNSQHPIISITCDPTIQRINQNLLWFQHLPYDEELLTNVFRLEPPFNPEYKTYANQPLLNVLSNFKP